MDSQKLSDSTYKWETHKTAAEEAQSSGRFSEAESHWLMALEQAESLGEGNLSLVITLEGLSELYWHYGKYSHSAPICRRLLRIYENSLGRDHMDVAVIANNLAMLYHTWKKYDEAEKFYKQALYIKHVHLDKDHPELVSLMASYARLLYETNRAQEAEALKASSQQFSQTWTRSGSWRAYEE